MRFDQPAVTVIVHRFRAARSIGALAAGQGRTEREDAG
jgi:hypothetical protein